jgi:hypothetical protein
MSNSFQARASTVIAMVFMLYCNVNANKFKRSERYFETQKKTSESKKALYW